MNDKFDDLAGGPAQCLRQREALRKFAVGLAGIALACFSLPAAAAVSADNAPPKTSEAIPCSQLGAKAGADYQGAGLAVTPTSDGARLRCVFQRLEGEATREGLWLT